MYDEEEKAKILSTVQKFRDEFYRVKELITNAASFEEINEIMTGVNFPEYQDE